jgi:Tfp pilus assembly protein PilF
VDESRTALETAISLEPGNLPAFESLANLYANQQQFDSAETVLLRGIAAVPGEARSHRALAAFLYRRAEYGRAAAEYDTVSHLDTSDAIAQRWRGDALRSLGRHSEALAAYRASLARDSSSAGGYYDYALGLAAAGDTVAAETAFVASLRRDSLSAAIHDGYGELLLNEAKWDAAAQYFQRAVALDSTQRTYLLDLILARFKGGREAEGMRLSDVMIAASPEDANAHLARASLMTSIGKPVEAATSAREAIRLDSTLVDAYLQLALAYMAQDDAAGADQALSAGLSRDSTATGLWSMRGMLYSVLGEHDTAMLYWQRALNLQPRLFEFLPQLEQYYKTSSRAAMDATLPPGMRPPE